MMKMKMKNESSKEGYLNFLVSKFLFISVLFP